MKMGIVTPILHMNPRFDPPGWEETGSVDDVVAVARAAEHAGMDWVACSEHIGIPESASGDPGRALLGPLHDARLHRRPHGRVGLLTHMVVLPYHHPLEIVKRLGTLDLLSHGRVMLGVGVGSLQPEFEVLGHRFEGGATAPTMRSARSGRHGVSGSRHTREPLQVLGFHRRAVRAAATGEGLGRRSDQALAPARAGARRCVDAVSARSSTS